MTLKELVEKYGEDTTIGISLYACGNTFVEDVTDKTIIKVKETKGKKKIIIDAEHN
jgi:hypothetical protein